MRTSAGFRILACICVLALLLAPALAPTGGTPAILAAAALLCGELSPCTPLGVPVPGAAPDPAVAACVPARAPPLT